MKTISNEEEYLKALKDLEKLQNSKRADTQKKLDALYAMIEEWEKAIPKDEVSRLDELREELAQYSEEEIKIYSVMAMKLLEFKKNKETGMDVTPPKFNSDLYESMREWVRLKAEINKEEAKLNK